MLLELLLRTMHPLNENKERGNTRGVNFRSQTGILFYPIIIDQVQTDSANDQKISNDKTLQSLDLPIEGKKILP